MNYYKLFLVLVLLVSPIQSEFVVFEKEKLVIQKQGKQIEITLPFKILEGYYIQEEKDVPDNIIPTTISFQNNSGYKITGYKFISENRKTILLDTTTHNVLNNEFSIKIFLSIENQVPKKGKKLAGEVSYQACNDKQCFYPRVVGFEVEFI